MKRAKKSLLPEAFEAACNSWEQHMKEFILQLSDGSIPTLRDVEWTVRNLHKAQINIFDSSNMNIIHVGVL